jgi:hypothetical protein
MVPAIWLLFPKKSQRTIQPFNGEPEKERRCRHESWRKHTRQGHKVAAAAAAAAALF